MSFYTSLSGLRAAQTDLSTISNNVANAGTTGFKKSRATFGDLFTAGPTQAAKSVIGHGTRSQGVTQAFGQGTITATERPLDLAIVGDGFFAVRKDGETVYTRAGNFAADRDGFVVGPKGDRLQLVPPGGGATIDLRIPGNDPADPDAGLATLLIGDDGAVSATYANGRVETLGHVAVARFAAVEGLRPLGDTRWGVTGDSGPARVGLPGVAGAGGVRGGVLELANVDLTEELVALIGAQRNFQANAQAIETASAMTQTIINLQV